MYNHRITLILFGVFIALALAAKDADGFALHQPPPRRFALYSKWLMEPKFPKTTKRYITTRAGKTEVIGQLKELLSRSSVLLRFTYKRFTPKERVVLNRKLRSFIYTGKDGSEPCAKLRMVKNTLIEKAMLGTQWEVFAPRMHGPSMCCFVFDDGRLPQILTAIERLRMADKKIRRHVTLDSASFAGKVVEPLELFRIADYASREDVIARLMCTLNGGSAGVARGLKSVAAKLAIALNETTKKGDASDAASSAPTSSTDNVATPEATAVAAASN
ncbi:membrane protein, putative [Babesia bigemina]|uniref:Membrane protein, putative n=1 Tax=Babesia bigemina TaxID=5866 RepID=A0A061D5T9_BABBI|nr:membrane protein, putative [Babesia bigemina]CDR95923.1 membrane protein, putative [Babesia bigemina]|eukprot:XP_012768109.1 membrane protein, putative [Babesia bigemina]